ncbi:hypothetical protein Q5752_007029 [Cryptotrichosporon argae]
MDDEDNDYELERQKTIAENRRLLDELGFDATSVRIDSPKPAAVGLKAKPSLKRKDKVVNIEPEGPRRRSGRLAGLEASSEEIKIKVEEEEREREALRVVARRTREPVMEIAGMLEDSDEATRGELDPFLQSLAASPTARDYPTTSMSAADAYAEPEAADVGIQRLREAFKDMQLSANAKVTSERVFTMTVHPEKTKCVVLVGDKYGQLGIWDALGPAPEKKEDEDGTGQGEEDDGEGRIWRVQAHARNSITCMRVDPADGAKLYTSSYDCSLRRLEFDSLKSTEVFSFADEDMLITHFDLTPSGQEAWVADKNGGISHIDFREGGERRRWVVQEEGRAAKLGGLSINPLMPHLICTAGNDQHVRIWDTRHLTKLAPTAADRLDVPKRESDTAAHVETHPNSSIGNEAIAAHMAGSKGKGLMRAAYQHGKSCSAAYWDPWGRRILTTSYDDKLRVWTLNPQSLMLDSPLAASHFQPSRVVPHNCQTGRWLTILRAQWSLNMNHVPHFTVGNMKRTLDVVAATGDKIVSLWADPVTAVPAVTASHPNRVDHVIGGNTSGRIQLWTSGAPA